MHCETKKFSVLGLFHKKNSIELNPAYQRQADVWALGKQQLFLDSLFNAYDVPKIYWHVLSRKSSPYKHALVDGKQRLQCIWDFMEGRIPLAKDFNLDAEQKKHPRSYPYPKGGDRFEALSPYWQKKFKTLKLDVVLIRGADEIGIEKIFFRLNNGESLKAPETRNAMGGKMPQLIRDLANKHKFFLDTISVSDKRYNHYDVVARFLLIENSLRTGAEGYCDLKKRFLDGLARTKVEDDEIDDLRKRVIKQLDSLVKIFDREDPLLRKTGYVQLYYLFVKEIETKYADRNLISLIKEFIPYFEQIRAEMQMRAPEEKRGDEDSFYLDDFERLMRQGNDKNSLQTRVSTMTRFFLAKNPEIRVRDRNRRFTDAERFFIYIRDGKQCKACEKEFKSFSEFQADHVVQWEHGGETTLDNARALCKSCNASINTRAG